MNSVIGKVARTTKLILFHQDLTAAPILIEDVQVERSINTLLVLMKSAVARSVVMLLPLQLF